MSRCGDGIGVAPTSWNLELRDTLRAMTDAIVAEHGEGTLPAVSMVGRFDHIRLQLAEFPGWQA